MRINQIDNPSGIIYLNSLGLMYFIVYIYIYIKSRSSMPIEESLIPPNLVSASMDQTLIFWNNKHKYSPTKGKYSGFRRIIEVGEYIIATSTFIELFYNFPHIRRK